MSRSGHPLSFQEYGKYILILINQHGFEQVDIQKVLTQNDPLSTLEALIRYSPRLREQLSQDEIIEICSGSTNGEENILFVCEESFNQFIKNSKLSINQIVCILKMSGVESLKKAFAAEKILKNYRYTTRMLFNIAKQQESSKNIQYLLDNLTRIENLQLTPAYISDSLSRHLGYKYLENDLAVRYEQFEEAHAEYKENTQLSSTEYQIDSMAILIDLHFNKMQAAMMLKSLHPQEYQSKIEQLKELINLHFDPNDLFDIVYFYNFRKLSVIKRMYPVLSQAQFSPKQIAIIVRYDKSGENIINILFPVMQRYGFSAKNLTQITGCTGGTANIKLLMEEVDAILKLNIPSKEIASNLGNHTSRKAYRENLRIRVNQGKPADNLPVASPQPLPVESVSIPCRKAPQCRNQRSYPAPIHVNPLASYGLQVPIYSHLWGYPIMMQYPFFGPFMTCVPIPTLAPHYSEEKRQSATRAANEENHGTERYPHQFAQVVADDLVEMPEPSAEVLAIMEKAAEIQVSPSSYPYSLSSNHASFFQPETSDDAAWADNVFSLNDTTETLNNTVSKKQKTAP